MGAGSSLGTMAVLLSDESMGILLLSSSHCSIRVGEDATQKSAKLGKQTGWRRRHEKKFSSRPAQLIPTADLANDLRNYGNHKCKRLRSNLDCNTAIYCCCADDACNCSCVAEVRPDS